MGGKKSDKERFKIIQKSYLEHVIFEGMPSEFFEKRIKDFEKSKALEKEKMMKNVKEA